ncbi:MAG: 50S ribosomal protein L10 [Acidobacteriota bacterium]
MTKAEKAQEIEQLHQTFRHTKSVLLINFSGLDVADATELRRKVAKVKSGYRVVKNTLALRAAENTSLQQLREHFDGPTAIAYTAEDPVALAKALTDFLKTRPEMGFKAGVLDQVALTSKQVEDLASMPSREELLSKLIYLLNSPLIRLAGALKSPLRDMVSVLAQWEKVKSE